ncbi:MAG: TonB-dependent receptor [Melioribacter sp.]|uniref:TonB-dependent receptor n=1 Tax=Rosettibacter primus TaxID=3111523 RepID=UPI00247D77CE|nr:TonB-dependent receptor [Melioribacter sp.]
MHTIKIKTLHFIIFLFLGFYSLLNAQQKFTISGIVIDEDQNPISNVNIKIEGTKIGASTDIKGNFEINNVDSGKYVIVLSAIGYETEKRIVDLSVNHKISLTFTLKKKSILLDNIVVTGTRTNKNILNTPIKTEIVTKNDIKNFAFTKLDQVIIEQPNLLVINEPWGKGVQMQGLDPDYTLVLIDGEPLIGRNAGTIDLSRFSVSNLKQIEIVKGPSSSLYGSEALAGVINLITDIPDNSYNLTFQSLYKTYNTLDVISNLSLTKEEVFKQNDKIYISLLLERLSSDGYKINSSSLSSTVPEFYNYSISPIIKYKINDSSFFKFNSRIFLQQQNNIEQASVLNEIKLVNTIDKLTDWNNSLLFEHRFTSSIKTEAKLYFSRYFTNSKSIFQNDYSIYEENIFDQYFYKAEIKNDFLLDTKNYLIVGAGYICETVKSDRIYDGKKNTSSYYFFAQEEWLPNDKFDFVIGARFDHHSDFTARLSPKFSMLFKPYNFLKIRASIGSGFKAPTLQQLYLNFTNAQVGYSVYGSSNIQESIKQLLESQQIQRILIDHKSISKIRAESSVGFNLGIEYSPTNSFFASINLFRNNVKDLIEASPIAIKTNGQSVFTYFNINKIYTEGIETSLAYSPFDNFSFSISYQYLQAIDEKILNEIRNGKISKVGSNGRIRLVRESEYGGLFNRSNHSGTIKLSYQNIELGILANLRGIIRSKYGFGDTNGNGILDDKSEYVPGYAVWNFTLKKQIKNNLNIVLGIENILDKTNPQFIPSLPGRIIYGGINIEFSKNTID